MSKKVHFIGIWIIFIILFVPALALKRSGVWERLAVLVDEMDSSKSVVIYASAGDSLDFGDTVSLFAALHGYENTEYDIQWQTNSGDGWEDIPGANETSYSFIFTEDNYANDWRVVVHVHEVVIPNEVMEGNF